jgi:hypothetical protein
VYEVALLAVECFDIAPQVFVCGVDSLAHLLLPRLGVCEAMELSCQKIGSNARGYAK